MRNINAHYTVTIRLQIDHDGGHGVNMLNEIIIKVNGICKECNQDTLVYDKTHDIVYCNKCGLVNKDNQAPGITKLIEDAQMEELERKELIRKFKEQERNQMLMLNKQGNYLFNQWIYMYW